MEWGDWALSGLKRSLIRGFRLEVTKNLVASRKKMNGRNFLAFLDASSCTCDAESACSLQVKKEGACR